MPADGIKITLAVFIFIFGACGVLSPRCFNPFGDNLSYANLLSCGVIIAASVVHLLPDASKALMSESFPWAFFIFGISFIALFAFERLLIHHFLHKKHHHHSTPKSSEQPLQTAPHHNHHHGQQEKHALDTFELLQEKNYLSAVILFCGLGLHSILAGLALGSSAENKQIITLGIAILSHKYLAAFAIGCSLYKSVIGSSLKKNIFIAISFAVLTPFGIIIGLCIESKIDTQGSNILVCIASGALLYAAICEIMIPEFSEEKSTEKQIYKNYQSQSINDHDTNIEACNAKKADYRDAIKVCCVFIGFGIMSMLALWV